MAIIYAQKRTKKYKIVRAKKCLCDHFWLRQGHTHHELFSSITFGMQKHISQCLRKKQKQTIKRFTDQAARNLMRDITLNLFAHDNKAAT